MSARLASAFAPTTPDRASWVRDLATLPIGAALADFQAREPAAYGILLAALDEVQVQTVDPKLTIDELRAIVAARRRALSWADAHHVAREALFAAWDAPDLRPVSALTNDSFVGELDFNLGFSVRTPIITELQSLMATDTLAAFDLMNRARDAGLLCWRRFSSLGMLERVLDARAPDTRPVALVIAPRADWNGAFNSMADGLAGLMATYRVVYVEAGSVPQALAASRAALDGAHADLVIFGGHGTDASVALGANRTDEELLDLTDFDEIGAFRTLCSDDAHFLMWACSAGARGPGSIADFVSAVTGLPTTGATAPYGFDYIETPRRRSSTVVPLPHGLSAIPFAGVTVPPATYGTRLSSRPSATTERAWAHRRYPHLPAVTVRAASAEERAALIEALRIEGVPARASDEPPADGLPVVTVGRRSFIGFVPELFEYIESFRARRR